MQNDIITYYSYNITIIYYVNGWFNRQVTLNVLTSLRLICQTRLTRRRLIIVPLLCYWVLHTSLI